MQEDRARVAVDSTTLSRWDDEEVREPSRCAPSRVEARVCVQVLRAARTRFVTGGHGQADGAAAAGAGDAEEDGDDEDHAAQFEDLEAEPRAAAAAGSGDDEGSGGGGGSESDGEGDESGGEQGGGPQANKDGAGGDGGALSAAAMEAERELWRRRKAAAKERFDEQYDQEQPERVAEQFGGGAELKERDKLNKARGAVPVCRRCMPQLRVTCCFCVRRAG